VPPLSALFWTIIGGPALGLFIGFGTGRLYDPTIGALEAIGNALERWGRSWGGLWGTFVLFMAALWIWGTVAVSIVWYWVMFWTVDKLYEAFVERHTFFNEGLAAFERRDFQSAERLLKAARLAKSDHLSAGVRLAVLGDIYNETGRSEEALEAYRESLAYVPTEIGVRGRVGVAYAEIGRLGDAARILEDALEEEPHNFELLVNLGYVYRSLGQTERAISVLKRGLLLNPDSSLAHQALAEAYWLAGGKELAAEEARTALALNPCADIAEAAQQILKAASAVG